MPDGSNREIASGTPFDRDELGCTEQQAVKLYRARHIAMVPGDGGNPGPAASSPPAPPPHRIAMPPALRLKSKGFGRFVVVDDNDRQVAPAEGTFRTRAEAEAYVSSN